MRARLRAETRALHSRVERACPFGPTLDRDLYADHLARRLGFQVAIERLLGQFHEWDAAGLAWPSDGAALLRIDLCSLGWSSSELAAVPVCDELPELSSFARALGCTYVLEGARLGGQTVAPAVARMLCEPASAVAFLSSGSPAATIRERFETAMAAIDRYARGLDRGGRDEIVAGACETFAALARWLEQDRSGHG